MSRRGKTNNNNSRYRGGTGQGRPNTNGRGHGRSNRTRSNNKNNYNKGKQENEIKFVPFYAGKQQAVTYETVRDTIIQKIQKEYYHGIDIVQSTRDNNYIDMNAENQ